VTPAQIRRSLAAAEARAQRLRDEAGLAEREAELMRQLLALHDGPNRSNIGSNMQADALAGKSREVKISANRTRKESPSRAAAVAANLPDGAIAKLLKVGRSSVNAWHRGTRAIPAACAAALEKRGIDRSVWPKVDY
jgi:hypothetical protein